MRNRVVPGEYVAGVTQDAFGETAYCVAENGGELKRDIDGEGDEPDFSNVELAGFTVILAASNTVNIGTMQEVGPTLPSEQTPSLR